MTIAERLKELRDRVDAAAIASGRSAESVLLLAVSKTQPAESIREAYAAGQRAFGENYVQELTAKARELGDLTDLAWHAIGSLQRNKARDVASIAKVVHTIDRAELAEELSKRAQRPIDVLIEVNVANEAQKAGCSETALDALADRVASLEHLRLVGLMTIPPLDADAEANRPHFARLKALAAAQQKRGHTALVELSMGMSSDFEVAIAEGATIVRVGTALFGARTPRVG